ncbi:hypothetical protein [Psychroserpens algicola]|uniref:Uncharacterized protein n=1 Tax=Psychroserpens algicola TaxID=1719034 RepID=A0ABT0H580_9FLAO|nr:hypothetical protein [Psychroserpens algicola]MCK8479528.1 hypothetical protein [Psychroserpens algicola]
MKRLLIGLAAFVFLIAMLYGGIHLFGKIIYESQSCELYNIDNIELRTGINVPQISSTDCECKDNRKVSKFVIDTNTVDVNDYISRNDFTLVDDLYIKENDTKNSTYKVVFNKKTAELIVDLTYKNN